MRLRSVTIDNFRAVKHLELASLDERLTVFHGDNGQGKTSVLRAIAVGLGAVPMLLPEVPGIGFLDADKRRSSRFVRVALETTSGVVWERQKGRFVNDPLRASTRHSEPGTASRPRSTFPSGRRQERLLVCVGQSHQVERGDRLSAARAGESGF